MTAQAVVQVVFVDAGTGQTIARAEQTSEQLPDRFDPGMTVYIGDQSYAIERSQPASKGEFVAAGALTLTVRRVEPVRAEGILYTLPTIFDVLPAVDDTAAAPGRLEVHEDDWRRVELVHRSVLDLVTRELDQVRRIYAEHVSRDSAGRVTGFTAIHVRNQPVRPLPGPVSLRHLGRVSCRRRRGRTRASASRAAAASCAAASPEPSAP